MNELIIQSIFTRIECNGLFNYNYFPLNNKDDLEDMESKILEKNVTGHNFRSRLVKTNTICVKSKLRNVMS